VGFSLNQGDEVPFFGRHHVQVRACNLDSGFDPAERVYTHGMPHFSAFLDGLDIQDRRASNDLNEPGPVAEGRSRELQRQELIKKLRKGGWLSSHPSDAQALVRACLELLSASPSPVILVSLEDLWLETQPQNVPGASDHPNWRRKLRHARQVFCELPQVTEILGEIDLVRKGGRRLRSRVRAE
jgi:4-alpha-glucanotransferase